MWRYCQEGDVEGATKVLEKMRELSMPVSEPVLNALVMGHAYHGDTDGAKAVLQTMAGAGLEPSNRTYTLLACGYAKKGDIDGIQATIKTANEKEALLTDRVKLIFYYNLRIFWSAIWKLSMRSKVGAASKHWHAAYTFSLRL